MTRLRLLARVAWAFMNKPLWYLRLLPKLEGFTLRSRIWHLYLADFYGLSDSLSIRGDSIRLRLVENKEIIVIEAPKNLLAEVVVEVGLAREHYKPLIRRGDKVLDVGGFLCETALLFTAWGASRVTVYEPVPSFTSICKDNLKLNPNLAGSIELVEAGVWFREGELSVAEAGASTGFFEGNLRITVKPLAKVLKEGWDLVKMDCEGCEYSLVALSCEDIRWCHRYVLEYHGPPLPLVDKFKSCGYTVAKQQLKLPSPPPGPQGMIVAELRY
jgi:FkbM family methyltransferase